MSQTKGKKRQNSKQTQKQKQKRKNIGNMIWAIAGCIIFGSIIGFFLGKYWLYPKYYGDSNYDNVQEIDSENDELQELNRQIEEEE